MQLREIAPAQSAGRLCFCLCLQVETHSDKLLFDKAHLSFQGRSAAKADLRRPGHNTGAFFVLLLSKRISPGCLWQLRAL